MKTTLLYNLQKLTDHEFYVMINDRRIRIKLMLSFLLILYVLSYSLFDKDTNILPFFFFGFFFVSPVIDYSFYLQRVQKRIPLLIGKGFSLREIVLAKTVLIFTFGVVSGIIFTSIALFLSSKGILNAVLTDDYILFMVLIALYNFWIILISGIIQIRFEIIFPVRLFNIIIFLLFVNYNSILTNSELKNNFFTLSFSAVILLILLTVFLGGRLNKDKLL